jgi:hypothetical protein
MSATTIKFQLQLSTFSCQNIYLHQHISLSSHRSVIYKNKGVKGFSHHGIFSLAELISRPHCLHTLYLNQAHSFKHIQYCISKLLIVLIFTIVLFKHTTLSYYSEFHSERSINHFLLLWFYNLSLPGSAFSISSVVLVMLTLTFLDNSTCYINKFIVHNESWTCAFHTFPNQRSNWSAFVCISWYSCMIF